MFSLLMCLSSTSSQAEVESLRAYIAAIRDGQCGTPSPQSLEKEYGVRWSRNDNDQDVRRLIAIEGLIGQLEIGSESSRKWMLRNLVEVGKVLHRVCGHELMDHAGVLAVIHGTDDANVVAIVHTCSQIEDLRHDRVEPFVHRFVWPTDRRFSDKQHISNSDSIRGRLDSRQRYSGG